LKNEDRLILDKLNTFKDRKLVPMLLENGSLALKADLLWNCNQDGYWSKYKDFLSTLEVMDFDLLESKTQLYMPKTKQSKDY
jgi:hypothetical protein